MNIEQARTNMVKQQLRTWDVRDERILTKFSELPREIFVPPAYQALAYADCQLPLDQRHALLPPKEEARLLQALAIQPQDSILELGTGTGWMTALLASLGRHVYSIDPCAAASQQAQTNLKRLGINNVTPLTGNFETLWGQNAPYSIIVVTGGSLPRIPNELKNCLSIGGRLGAIVGTGSLMEAIIVHRSAENRWNSTKLFETRCPRLETWPEPKTFHF